MNSPGSGVSGASYSPECEKAVLGAILLGNSLYERIAQIIGTPEAFFSPMHRQLWTAMTNLHLSGRPIDVVLVRNELVRIVDPIDSELNRFLNEVMSSAHFTLHAEFYAKEVRNGFVKRQLLEISNRIECRVHSGDDPADLIPALLTELGTLGDKCRKQSFLGQTFEELLAHDFPEVDWLSQGIFQAGETCVLLAPSKAMKTTILFDLTVALASGTAFMDRFHVDKPRKVLFLLGETPESKAKELLRRACRIREVDPNSIAKLIRLHAGPLPQLISDKDLWTLERDVLPFGPGVVILDPFYLAAFGLNMREVNEVGPRIRALADACKPATLIFSHHVTKTDARKMGKSLQLESGSGAGIAESVGQWLIINRRKEFRPESSRVHELSASYGGRGGQCGRLQITIDEATGKFETSGTAIDQVSHVGEATNSHASNAIRNRKLARNEVTRILADSPYPMSANQLRKLISRLKKLAIPDTACRQTIQEMERTGALLRCKYRVPGSGRRSLTGLILAEQRERFQDEEWILEISEPLSGNAA